MIDTKIKTMMVAAGLVAVLSGCEKKISEDYKIVDMPMPSICKEVLEFSQARGNDGAGPYVKCIDAKGYQVLCSKSGYCTRLVDKKDSE